jgi:hypothetical protein
MTSTAKMALAATALLALGACAPNTSADDRADIRAPEARVVGEPVNCVDTSRIRTTRVHDDYTIDFEMTGGMVYRNTLPVRCSSLGFERSFTYDLRGTTRLCSADVIRVLQGDRYEGAGCGLGQFVPVIT